MSVKEMIESIRMGTTYTFKVVKAATVAKKTNRSSRIRYRHCSNIVYVRIHHFTGSTTVVSADNGYKKTPTYYTTDTFAKTTFAAFLTSMSKSKNESQSGCKCRCSSHQNLIGQLTKSGSHNYTIDDLKQLMQEELREMSEGLRVQKNLTSAWVRARRSADDRRMISAGIGYVAIVVIAMPFVLAVVSDCRKLK
ncbi:unnamed protein product [Mytilus coruscus]|uniref:Uncharacterized protein n=1 Tax=Mytilus coruscus TaxID=42192 RepID=A0A6J8F2K3_MYTCO|nr:unnamed protein product [Mytilus coruscus]